MGTLLIGYDVEWRGEGDVTPRFLEQARSLLDQRAPGGAPIAHERDDAARTAWHPAMSMQSTMWFKIQGTLTHTPGIVAPSIRAR